MSQRAKDYVDSLSRQQVTCSQKGVLRVIAEEHNERFDATYLDIATLEQVTLLSRRHLARVLKAVPEILEYQPGSGRGNFAVFRFPQMPGRLVVAVENAVDIAIKDDKKVTKRCQKGDILGSAIRKDLNLDQNQEQNPPNPLSAKGGMYRLSNRDHARLARFWTRVLSKPSAGGRDLYWAALVREACADLALSFEDAVHDLLTMDAELWEARLGLRKPAQAS